MTGEESSGNALFRFEPASVPLLISVPHAGTKLDKAIADRMTPTALEVPDTDWHVDKLYEFATATGVGMIVARHSRYAIDLNRDPENVPLYPGMRNTGLVPTRTFDGVEIYEGSSEPGDTEVADRIQSYWRPYHERLRSELDRLHREFGAVVLLDGHSIRSHVPTLFDGKLPDLNLGSNGGDSADPQLSDVAFKILNSADGFSAVHNGRFKGGYITRHYGRPADGIHALQLEIGESCYLDEEKPNPYDPARAASLQAVLSDLVAELQNWGRSQ
jgi:N-formylglutamate deformylase